jgi:hypothetical protein
LALEALKFAMTRRHRESIALGVGLIPLILRDPSPELPFGRNSLPAFGSAST